jgi:cytochrome c biogenesis protein CcmG, thiol:disulfide interchange protein DsbE
VSARAFWAFLAVLAVVGLLAYGLASKGSASISVGDQAPGRSLPRLQGKGAGEIADYRGGWVLVNVWASWCPPCRDEAPALERFYRRERRHDFTVLGIDSRDVTSDAIDFLRRYRITYPQLRDGSAELYDDLGMTGYPESFLVDPQGKLALIRRGAVTPSYLDDVVRPFLTGEARS